MPVNADSAFVTNFSTYFADNLDSNLKVYVEYGNEVWNSGYTDANNFVHAYEVANNLEFPQATAVLATNMWNVWRQSFAGQTDRVVRVLANQFSQHMGFTTTRSVIWSITSAARPTPTTGSMWWPVRLISDQTPVPIMHKRPFSRSSRTRLPRSARCRPN